MKKLSYVLSLALLVPLSVYPIRQETEPALQAFADSIEQTINNMDPAFLNRAMDYHSFLDGILMEGGRQPDSLRLFNEGFQSEFTGSFTLGGEILRSIANNGFYTFLKAYRQDEEDHLLFRLYSNSGLNYHDYTVVRKNGRFMIRDAYIYLSGERMSETIRRIYISYAGTLLIGTENPETTMDQMFGILGLRTIQEYMAKGLYQEASDLFDSLPKRIRNEKAFQVLGLRIRSNMDEKRYHQSVQEMARCFPGDPSLYLVAIDGSYLLGQYHEALAYVDSLDLTTGGDPILDLYRGNLSFSAGDTLKAEMAYYRLMNKLPAFELGYANLVDLYISQLRFTDALTILDEYLDQFEVTKEQLLRWVNSYTAFGESDEFREWIDKIQW